MTPLQAEMLSQSMALVGSVIACELLDLDNFDPRLFQQNIAKEMRKAFRAQLTSLHLITNDPNPSQRRTGARSSIGHNGPHKSPRPANPAE